VDWSPNGKLLASGSGNDVQIWDTTSWQLSSTLKGHSLQVRSVSWSPDGKGLASGGDDGVVKVWDVRGGKAIASLSLVDVINEVAWSPSGRYIAIASANHNVYIWDVSNLNVGGPTATSSQP